MSYGQFCPLAKAAEVFATKWTPLVLRELMNGHSRFNDLKRGVPLMSRTLLALRLKELEDAGLVESIKKESGAGSEYLLTRAGESFRPIVEAMGQWGHAYGWARVTEQDYDPALLMWAMRRGIKVEALPAQRVTIRFEFSGLPKGKTARRLWWLVLDHGQIDVCLKRPGFPEDVVVRADLQSFIRVWMRKDQHAAALRQGSIAYEGPPALVKQLPEWLRIPPSANAPFTLLPPGPVTPHAGGMR